MITKKRIQTPEFIKTRAKGKERVGKEGEKGKNKKTSQKERLQFDDAKKIPWLPQRTVELTAKASRTSSMIGSACCL